MKISCTHQNLAEAISYLEWVVGRQSHLPIVSNILFEAMNGRLKLSATNLEIGVVAPIGAKVEEEGVALLPAKVLAQFIQNINPQEVVSLSSEGGRVRIENSRDSILINTIESKDFPLIPELHGEYALTLTGNVLIEACRKVLFAVSTNENRAELTGVYLSASERGIHVAATDSFRLAEYTLAQLEVAEGGELAQWLKENGGVILPVDTVQELIRIVEKDTAGQVSIAVAENQVFFDIGGVKLVSRIIQGKYPEYEQILPREFQQIVAVQKNELLRALKMATSFAQYGSGEVTFRFSHEQGLLEVATASQGVGEQHTTIELEKAPAQDVELVFQPRHVLEGVNALQGEVIQFHLNTKDMAVLLMGAASGDQLYLIMPIRK